MNRRDFFKMIAASASLPPLFSDSSSLSLSSELYLISNSPQLHLPLIFEELDKFSFNPVSSFILRNFHPQAGDIKKTLSLKGWRLVDKETLADISLSFGFLRQAASPSFTLIKRGRILDIRSEKLLVLWKELAGSGSLSTSLTIASFKKGLQLLQPGTEASIYIDGRKKASLLLKGNFSRTFYTKRGEVTVSFENGKVVVQDSSCRNKICCFSPPAFLSGERIICAPNHFLLEIDGPRLVDTVIG